MGVGTMIIFIAMSSWPLLAPRPDQHRQHGAGQATQTGNDAITNVASGFDIKYVKGTVGEDEKCEQNRLYRHVYSTFAGSPALSGGCHIS